MTMYQTAVLSGAVGIVVVAILVKLSKRTQLYPPVEGWIPWLGCAVEFGKEPLHFIEATRRKLGPIFTMKVAGQRLTFLTQPDDFIHFFQSKHVDFQQAVQDSVQNAAAVSKESFMKYHTNIHDTVKARLAPAQLHSFCRQLSESFQCEQNKYLNHEGSCSLLDFVRRTMYLCDLDCVMGKNILPTHSQREFKEVESHFITYDDQFEYGAKLPAFLLRDWKQSRSWLMNLFQKIVSNLQNEHSSSQHSQTVLSSLIETVDAEHAPNYALLLMWALLANAIPITFWTLAFIFQDESVYSQVTKEIESVLQSKPEGSDDVTMEDLQQMKQLRSCILEAIRLRAPGVIPRRVVTPFQVKEFVIPAGDMLMLSPYWAHRDEKLFPDPEKFNPDRWCDCDYEKKSLLEGFIAFGGGRYQCPGRWFAIMEIQLFIFTLLRHYDISPISSVPKPSPKHVVGTQQPECDVSVKYKRKIVL